MDKLQRAQIGTRFVVIVLPPLESGILWPAWKSQTLIILWHQGVLHLASKIFPKSLSQICSRMALGIGLRFILGYTRLVQEGIYNRYKEALSLVTFTFTRPKGKWLFSF